MKSTFADVDDLIRDFDYKPDTPLVEGITEFAKWYESFIKQVTLNKKDETRI